MFVGELPKEARGLKLYRYGRNDSLIACETMMFPDGFGAVHTTLNRASISGRVEIGGKIKMHFADIYVDGNTWVESVALDAGSYGALKNKWMRCKVESQG